MKILSVVVAVVCLLSIHLLLSCGASVDAGIPWLAVATLEAVCFLPGEQPEVEVESSSHCHQRRVLFRLAGELHGFAVAAMGVVSPHLGGPRLRGG